MFKRIISLAPSNTEILFALGLENKIVGRTYLCDYPKKAQKIQPIGSWIKINDLYKIEKLKPDLILTSMYIPKNIEDWCDRNGVKLVNVYPQTIEGIYKSILNIGRLTDKREEAEKIIYNIAKSLINIAINKPKHKPKIYCEEFHNPPTASANWVPELIQIAGGIPFSKKGILSYETKLEELKKFDPYLIILHWCGFKTKSNKNLLLKRPGWSELRAVKNQNIFVIDDTYLNRPGPRIWLGARKIQEVINRTTIK